MYISRLPLNLMRSRAMDLVRSPYRMHAAVEQAFPPAAERETGEGRILWRIDFADGQSHECWLYVVSPEKPDFTHIVEQAGWPANAEWETKDYSPVIDALKDGQIWHFQLKANPARKVLVDKGTTPNDKVVGTIQGHVTREQQEQWLLDRAEKQGFRIITSEDGIPLLKVCQRHIEKFNRNGKKVTIGTVVFEGVLVVTDADLFRHALCHGIGRAKGFGCGLMTIAPEH